MIECLNVYSFTINLITGDFMTVYFARYPKKEEFVNKEIEKVLGDSGLRFNEKVTQIGKLCEGRGGKCEYEVKAINETAWNYDTETRSIKVDLANTPCIAKNFFSNKIGVYDDARHGSKGKKSAAPVPDEDGKVEHSAGIIFSEWKDIKSFFELIGVNITHPYFIDFEKNDYYTPASESVWNTRKITVTNRIVPPFEVSDKESMKQLIKLGAFITLSDEIKGLIQLAELEVPLERFLSPQSLLRISRLIISGHITSDDPLYKVFIKATQENFDKDIIAVPAPLISPARSGSSLFSSSLLGSVAPVPVSSQDGNPSQDKIVPLPGLAQNSMAPVPSSSQDGSLYRFGL
jgi:hypothetical protein